MRRALLAALLLATPASAWEAYRGSDAQLILWQGFPVKLRLAAAADARAPEGWQLAARRALGTWQAVASAGAAFRYSGKAAADELPAIGEAIVVFDGAAFPADRDAIAITELGIERPHSIVAARVHLNGRDFDWKTDGSNDALDVESVALHELGHALGLAHPCGDAGTGTPSCASLTAARRAELEKSAMWPAAGAGARRTLADDDVAGLSALHPVPSSVPAPAIAKLEPACAESIAGLLVRVSGSGGDRLILADDGAPLVEVALGADLSARLPEGLRLRGGRVALDALLVSSASGKAAELPAALIAGATCAASHGCSTAGATPAWALVGLLAFGGRRRLWALAALFCAAVPARAYVRETAGPGGPCLFWGPRGFAFMIDSRGSPDVPGLAVFEAVRTSFRTWSGATCSNLAFPDFGLSTNPDDRRVGYVPGKYNRNLIMWRTANCRLGGAPPDDPCLKDRTCGNKYDCWDKGDSAIAVTTTTFNRTTGQIYDADIELNDAPHEDGSKFTFTVNDGPPCIDPGQTGCVRFDVQNTATHEIGHGIGLGHTPDSTATMYAFAPEGETAKRSLHADDLKGICEIYPKGLRTVTCLGDPVQLVYDGSSDGGGCGCSSRSSAGLFGVLLFFALAWRARGGARR